MFIQTAFLLLLAGFASIESVKIHDVIKKLGKRFEDPSLWGYAAPEPRGGVWFDPCTDGHARCQVNKFTDEKMRNIKLTSARALLATLYQTSSTENEYYQYAMTWLPTILNPDMTAEICDSGTAKKMNAFQYLKYYMETAALFQPIPKIKWPTRIGTTPRGILQFSTDIVLFDKKFNLSAQVHYEVKATLNPKFKSEGTWYTIENIYQGGVCPQDGALVYKNDDEIDVIIDDIEQLKNHPTARTLLNFFTPLAYQFTDPEYRRVPSFWITGLKKDVTQMYVCHDSLDEPKQYTEEEFRSWYRRFGVMWHPKRDEEDDFTDLNVLKIEENAIIAIVTMNLQMALDEKIRKWNFKVSGAKGPSKNDTWYIDRLELPCNPDFSRKDESFRGIRDVIATTFVEDLVDLPDPSQWYSTLSFVKRFTHHGFKGWKYCDWEKVQTKSPKEDLFIFDRNVRKISKYTKYWINHTDVITSPAPSEGQVSFKTISLSEIGNKKTEYENEWKFDIKWHEMDQFYYVQQMEIGCHKKIINSDYGDGVVYLDIDYDTPEDVE